jgi:hypothetical protein
VTKVDIPECAKVVQTMPWVGFLLPTSGARVGMTAADMAFAARITFYVAICSQQPRCAGYNAASLDAVVDLFIMWCARCSVHEVQ